MPPTITKGTAAPRRAMSTGPADTKRHSSTNDPMRKPVVLFMAGMVRADVGDFRVLYWGT